MAIMSEAKAVFEEWIAAVAGAVLGFNFLGDVLRDQLDPRTRL